MFREVTTPIRTNAILIGEAELFGELPGSYSLASAAEGARVGGRAATARPITADHQPRLQGDYEQRGTLRF
jgi:hypothetical protein